MLLTNRIIGQLDPVRAFRAIEQQWGQQLGDWFQAAASALWNPGSFRMWNADGRAVVEFELPGAAPESIDVSVHRNLLTIEAAASGSAGDGNGEFHLRERLPHQRRSFQLPFEADPARTEAEYIDGVLRITLHQVEAHRPAKIAVKGV
jgi:HSP20 family molecular chaperone IbpA